MRRPSNALALAVLALLSEKPMHPYEISSTLRDRHKEDSIKINYGSLYAVVESLEKKDLIQARERIRDGRRPERTVVDLDAVFLAPHAQGAGDLVRVHRLLVQQREHRQRERVRRPPHAHHHPYSTSCTRFRVYEPEHPLQAFSS